MEALWITSKICVPIIVVGATLYIFRQQIAPFWRRCSQLKFIPSPFTDADAGLTALAFGYAVFVVVVISRSDPFARGVLYLGSVMLGTLILAFVRSPFRCFYTVIFTLTIYLWFVGTVMVSKGKWDLDSIIVMPILFLFLVILPAAISWIITVFRKKNHDR